jgi:hypothetical protein
MVIVDPRNDELHGGGEANGCSLGWSLSSHMHSGKQDAVMRKWVWGRSRGCGFGVSAVDVRLIIQCKKRSVVPKIRSTSFINGMYRINLSVVLTGSRIKQN